jgi:hypothetical protein
MPNEFFKDPNESTHKSNKKKNDYLSDIMITLPIEKHIIQVIRVDKDGHHGWELVSI